MGPRPIDGRPGTWWRKWHRQPRHESEELEAWAASHLRHSPKRGACFERCLLSTGSQEVRAATKWGRRRQSPRIPSVRIVAANRSWKGTPEGPWPEKPDPIRHSLCQGPAPPARHSQTAARVMTPVSTATQGLSVGGAATRVGYSSPSQFSREFRRQFGQAPREWRGLNVELDVQASVP